MCTTPAPLRGALEASTVTLTQLIVDFCTDHSSDMVREDRFKKELFLHIGRKFDKIYATLQDREAADQRRDRAQAQARPPRTSRDQLVESQQPSRSSMVDVVGGGGASGGDMREGRQRRPTLNSVHV